MSPVLVTGSAGFIGYHVCEYLLKRQETVIGIDNLNDYYDPNLKKARLKILQAYKNFHFEPLDLSDRKAMSQFTDKHPNIERIVHLAAQAGVRYSLQNPFAYTDANIQGHLAILEACRKLPLKHLVYASSSSVYGTNEKLPFAIEDPVDTPMSLYAVTKRSCELMSFCYSHLFQIPSTGLRFFTVYGPWGRPDMSAFIFTRAIFENQEIPVFNYGDMRRNFTYIDDIVQGTIACLDAPPVPKTVQHRLYNIGNDRSESLMDFIHTLEKITGKKANINLMPIQPGDVKETIADITNTTQDFGFQPKTNIEEGLTHFVHWYREFYDV
jgi:UDP-glucuronate 4-epimerase